MAGNDRFVLDASIAVAWCFPDEQAPYPQSVLEALAESTAVVASLWPLEVTNALLVAERRKRCTPAEVATWTGFLQALPIEIDDETSKHAWSNTLGIARARNLSVYDAAYLELALRHGKRLATLDQPLKAAARAVGVALYKP